MQIVILYHGELIQYREVHACISWIWSNLYYKTLVEINSTSIAYPTDLLNQIHAGFYFILIIFPSPSSLRFLHLIAHISLKWIFLLLLRYLFRTSGVTFYSFLSRKLTASLEGFLHHTWVIRRIFMIFLLTYSHYLDIFLMNLFKVWPIPI